VITLVCVIVLLHASVNVQVSVTLPPHGPGNAPSVDVTVPLIKQAPVALLVYARSLVTAAPHATVIGAAAANTAGGAAETVIVLVCVIVLLHASVNVQVSVTVPPHGPGNALKVDVTVPLIKQVPLALLVYVRSDVTAAPHATVIGAAAANTAGGAAETVIVLVCVIVLLHASVNVQVSVTLPPHGPGNAPSVDVTVPLIKQVPLALLVYVRSDVTAAPHATVIGAAAANTAGGAGLTVITLV
jgi:hypothetical protein